MDLKTRLSDRTTILELIGRFDSYESPAVLEWLTNVAETASPQVVVNLSGVSFMDSTALATLVHGMKKCRQQQGDLRLCGLQETTQKIFELTRLDKAFEIFQDEVQAIKSFSS